METNKFYFLQWVPPNSERSVLGCIEADLCNRTIARDNRPWQCKEVRGVRRRAGENLCTNFDISFDTSFGTLSRPAADLIYTNFSYGPPLLARKNASFNSAFKRFFSNLPEKILAFFARCLGPPRHSRCPERLRALRFNQRPAR